MKKLKNN